MRICVACEMHTELQMELLKGRANLGDNNESSVSIEGKEFLEQLSD
jgi:hypothetical protein